VAKNKGKNKGKVKATKPAELSKKERAKLKAREAELAAKLEAKANRKAHAKAQGKAKTKGAAEGPTKSGDTSASGTRHPHIEHLDRVGELIKIKADKSLPKSKRKAAEAELEQLRTEGAARIAANDAARAASGKVDKTTTPLDAKTAELKARIAAKVQARNVGIDIDDIDRTNADEVAAVNAELAAAGIELTIEAVVPKGVEAARMPDALEGETEVEYQQRKLKDKATKSKLKAAVAAVAEATEAVEQQVATEVLTETGREFAVGSDGAGVVDGDLGTESLDPDAPAEPPIALSPDGKRYLITRPDGTEAKYTRATTYIDGLEDSHGLDAWRLRTLLEGIVVDTERTLGDRDHAASLVGKVTEAVHARDVALRKLDKADRKGKLELGERGLVEVKIAQAFKAVVDEVADEALELGGAHVKANKGTDLHKLTEVCDEHGIEHIRMLEAAGTITPADLADIEAYDRAMKAAGIKVIATEQVVVNDELGVAGTLDRTVQVPGKLIGRQRGAKLVADIKTGSMEYGRGKVAMQTCLYATSKTYEAGSPDRGELGVLKPTTAKHPGKAPLKKDRPLKRDGAEAMAAYEARVAKYEADLANYNAKRGLALLIHLPQGEAKCTLHLIDLNVGARGLEVATAVRAWRNEGKAAVDLKADLLAPVEAPAAEAEGAES
jgi:hypothetical protein